MVVLEMWVRVLLFVGDATGKREVSILNYWNQKERTRYISDLQKLLGMRQKETSINRSIRLMEFPIYMNASRPDS